MKVRYRFKGDKATYGLDDIEFFEIIEEKVGGGENMNVCDKLRKNYVPNEVVCRVKILGEIVPVSREEALMLFGCREVES